MTEQYKKLMGMAVLFEQIGRNVHVREGPSNLQPAQWSALRFFQRAGREARTASGLAQYLGVTLGPACRAARALEHRGMLSSSCNSEDRRSVYYSITDAGEKKMNGDPLLRLSKALGELDVEARSHFSQTLIQITANLRKPG